MDFNTQHILKLLELGKDKGIDTATICDAIGLDVNSLFQGKATVSETQMEQLWGELIAETGDQNLGLQLGERYNFTALGLVGNMIQNASNIEEALKNVVQFSNLITGLLHFEMEKLDKTFVLKFIPNPHCLLEYPLATMETVKTSMVFALKEYQLLTFQKAYPAYAEFAIGITSYFDFQRIFRCEFQDNAPQFALFFDNKILEQPIIGADFQLLNILIERANQLLQEHSSNQISQKVKHTLLQQFNNGFLTIGDVARLLNISVRTLQRQLLEEKTNFNRVLDEVKKDLALYYLKRDVTVKEIAEILGYQNLSSFSRSFKKWVGVSPRGYLKR
jgi:AraC-like DNA-binding protein